MPVDIIFFILKNFYSDTHDIVFRFILNSKYVSNSVISIKLFINIEKVKAITSSLFNEKFIRFHDRLYKKTIVGPNLNSEEKRKKVYRVRYWFVEEDNCVNEIKKKLESKLTPKEIGAGLENSQMFICTRKYCNSIYSFKDLDRLKYDSKLKSFVCSRMIGEKVICGSKLKYNNENRNIEKIDSLDNELEKIKKFIV